MAGYAPATPFHFEEKTNKKLRHFKYSDRLAANRVVLFWRNEMNGETYEEFVEKFKRKKTTDDCYTPPEIYELVKNWACREYEINPDCIVRPFWPGGNYESYDYPDGCVVLDNPPFSILSKICMFYLNRDIAFFLFAPSLTALAGRNIVMRMNHIFCDTRIEYENGAIVNTAFVTSFGGDTVIQTAPELGESINNAVKALRWKKKKELSRYEYPDNVLTAAAMNRLSEHGVDCRIRRGDCIQISKLDAQKEYGKAIFGGGLLLSDKAAAERVAAERKAAAERKMVHKWELSDREKELIARMG